MDLPATQAIDDEDLIPTQQLAADDRGHEPSLVGKLLVNNTDEQHSIFSGTTVIGRQPGCTIWLNDETVSKKHAEIEAESSDKAIFIKDLRSSNKTKINDTKLKPEASYQIKDNDKLTFGKITATFKIHRSIDDSLVAGTPQVNRNRAVIPDTPDTSMNNSSTAEGDVSTIPGTQADENDSCFRRPQIPVRTSISNEHESPKHVPFMLDDVPSPLANNKHKESDISEAETQRFTVDNTKEITDNSIYTVETQKVVIHEKSGANSHDNEDKRKLNNSSIRKVLSNEFENQPLEDMETQTFACAKSDSSSRRSENTSIYSAETQKVLPDATENQSIENMETQAYVPAKSDNDKSNLADVSIHSAATQKIESAVLENDQIENMDTQPFSRNSLSCAKRKSANISIYSAETQKLVADVSNQALDNIETQQFVSTSASSKETSADVAIYSATTQKIESASENGAIENLETQKFDQKGSHQEKMDSSLSFSIQDIDTMPFTKHELPLGEKSSNTEVENADDILLNSAPLDEKSSNVETQNDNNISLDSAPNASKSDSDNKVHVSENDNDKSDSKMEQSLPTPSKKLDKTQTGDKIMQNKKQINESLSKSSTDLHQTSSKLNKSKSLVESDNEEEIFSQNLIENSPFALLLDDSKNDSKEQSNLDLQKDLEHENEKTIDSECNTSSNKTDSSSTDNKTLTKNKSRIVSNYDSETDEEGAFSNQLSEEIENQKSHQKTGSDSETDEEGVFSNHASEGKGEKSNSKPDESDSETDEEGVFSGRLSKSFKGSKNSSSKIIEESESEDEGVSSNLSKAETTRNSIGPDDNNAKTVDSLPSTDEPTKKRSLNKLNEIVQRESPAPESDDDIFNENYEEKETSSSNLDKTNNPIVDKDNLDSMQKSSVADTMNSKPSENHSNDVDDMAPTQIIETDMSLAPTQIVNTRRMSASEEDEPKEIDELAPTQLIETQQLPRNTENTPSTPARKQSIVADSVKAVPKQYDDMDLAPTQKLVETQECDESLAPTQKVIDTQPCTEEMGALQFTESLGPTQVIDNESNAVENEIAASPKISASTSKRQLEEVEITSHKKQKTAEVSQRVEVDLNGTVEHNLNEMFEGPEEKLANSEPPMATQRLENILESSQTEEESATALDASTSQPSPTLSNKRGSIKAKNRRRPLSLNKSTWSNTTDRSVVNLNDTIEMNLNDLFHNTVESVEAPEPEPMLTQQLENVLNSSQESDPSENKEEAGRTLTVSRRKSRLSLSMNLNKSMRKTQQEKDIRSSNAQSAKLIETTPQSSSNEKTPQKEDYAANFEETKDNAITETPSKNDKDIVYRRGTIGFTDDLKPVSTFDRVAFTDKYSTSDSQSDGDDITKLKSPDTPSSKKRVSLRLKSVDLNSSLSSSTSDRDIVKKQVKSPVLSQSKKRATIHNRSARKRNPIVQSNKLASPLKHTKPVKRVMACGIIGFTPDLQPIESEELVSAASTESEDDLRSQVGMSSPKFNKEVDQEKLSPGLPAKDKKLSTDSPTEDKKQCPESPVEEVKQTSNSPVEDEMQSPDSPMEDDKSDSEDDFLKAFPAAKIAGTAECPATTSQINAPSDTDTESLNSVKIEIPDRWKWYGEKRYDSIYEKYKVNKKSKNDSESENDEDKQIQANNVAADSTKDDQEERVAAINELLARIGADKEGKKRKSKTATHNDSGKENAHENVHATRSRTLRKANTPPPKPVEDAAADSDKTDEVSSSSDDENSQELSIIPKIKLPPPLKIDMAMLTAELDDEEDSELEFEAPRPKPTVNRAKARTSPLKTRRQRRKSACNNDITDLTQSENNTNDHHKKTATPNVGTVDKSGLVFQVSRDSKTTTTTTTTTTSRTSGATINRTKRIIDSEDDDSESATREPSAKRTKILADRRELQHATVVISPLQDKLRKSREAKRLNVANVSSNFKQPDANLEEEKTTRAPKILDGHVAKTARTDSSDMSAVESSIVEDKNESKNKPKTRGRAAARNKKAKVDTSSERSANSSKENVEEPDVEKPKTRGRGRRNQATDSSVSDKASSQDEVPASDVENKSTRSTRGRLVRPNQAKKEEAKATKKQSQEVEGSDTEEPEKPKTVARKNTRKATKQESKAIEDSDSEVAEETKPAVKKSTRGRLAKTNDKSASGKKDVADSTNDKTRDKESESQLSSQSESVTARSTRTRKNKVNQESDSGSSEAPEATTTKTTRGSRKRPANDKPDLIVKVTEDDSKAETMTKSEKTKDEQSTDEVNIFKVMKKKMNLKPEEPKKAPARKTRTRATKNATVVPENSSEESQEVAEIMKNSVAEDSKTTTTRRRGRAMKSNLSYAENTESSDDVFEKPTARPKRARLAKADNSQSSQVSDTDEDSKPSQSSQKSTRRKHSPSPSPMPTSDAVLTSSRTSRLSLSPSKRPKVLFTGDKSDAHRNILTKLGGVETEEFNSCSVLISDKVRRTFKFLCSLARGIPIASVKWLDESKKANRFLDLEEYILNDPEGEAKFKFNLKESLDKARKHKLLEGYSVLLAPKIKQPLIAELKEMVLSSGGKPILRAPAKWPEKCVVVTAEQELDSAKKLTAKAPKSVTVHSIEFILTGILRQEVNFNEFKLLG